MPINPTDNLAQLDIYPGNIRQKWPAIYEGFYTQAEFGSILKYCQTTFPHAIVEIVEPVALRFTFANKEDLCIFVLTYRA